MRNGLSALLLFFFCLALTGCGKADKHDEEQKEHREAEKPKIERIDVDSLSYAQIYAKYKDARPAARVDFGDLLEEPQQYKGLILVSRVRMRGLTFAFSPLGARRDSMPFQFRYEGAPEELNEKWQRLLMTFGERSYVSITYVPTRDTLHIWDVGVLLDVKR